MVNRYFCDEGTNLAKAIVPRKHIFEEKQADSTFTGDFGISEIEFRKEICSLDMNKSSGVSGLSTKILRPSLLHDEVIFTRLLNTCITLGVFSEQWKKTIVVPIPKVNKLSPWVILDLSYFTGSG